MATLPTLTVVTPATAPATAAAAAAAAPARRKKKRLRISSSSSSSSSVRISKHKRQRQRQQQQPPKKAWTSYLPSSSSSSDLEADLVLGPDGKPIVVYTQPASSDTKPKTKPKTKSKKGKFNINDYDIQEPLWFGTPEGKMMGCYVCYYRNNKCTMATAGSKGRSCWVRGHINIIQKSRQFDDLPEVTPEEVNQLKRLSGDSPGDPTGDESGNSSGDVKNMDLSTWLVKNISYQQDALKYWGKADIYESELKKAKEIILKQNEKIDTLHGNLCFAEDLVRCFNTKIAAEAQDALQTYISEQQIAMDAKTREHQAQLQKIKEEREEIMAQAKAQAKKEALKEALQEARAQARAEAEAQATAQAQAAIQARMKKLQEVLNQKEW